jgi:hypothetical protein
MAGRGKTRDNNTCTAQSQQESKREEICNKKENNLFHLLSPKKKIQQQITEALLRGILNSRDLSEETGIPRPNILLIILYHFFILSMRHFFPFIPHLCFSSLVFSSVVSPAMTSKFRYDALIFSYFLFN